MSTVLTCAPTARTACTEASNAARQPGESDARSSSRGTATTGAERSPSRTSAGHGRRTGSSGSAPVIVRVARTPSARSRVKVVTTS